MLPSQEGAYLKDVAAVKGVCGETAAACRRLAACPRICGAHSRTLKLSMKNSTMVHCGGGDNSFEYGYDLDEATVFEQASGTIHRV